MSEDLQARFDKALRRDRKRLKPSTVVSVADPSAIRIAGDIEVVAVKPTLYLEDSVASLLGIARQRLRKIRKHLKPAEHWTFDVVTRKLAYTEAGLALLREILPASTETAASETNPANGLESAKAGPLRTAQMRVLRTYPNPRLMLCADVKTPEVAVLVKVKDNANFIQGMQIPVVADALGHWQYAGRLPRRKGKL